MHSVNGNIINKSGNYKLEKEEVDINTENYDRREK